MLKKEKKEKQMETIYKIIGVVSLLTAGFILIKIIMWYNILCIFFIFCHV